MSQVGAEDKSPGETEVDTTSKSSGEEKSQENAADQYLVEDLKVQDIGEPQAQTSIKVMSTEQESKTDTADKSVDLEAKLSAADKSEQQESQTFTSVKSGDLKTQADKAEKSKYPEVLKDTTDKSAEQDNTYSEENKTYAQVTEEALSESLTDKLTPKPESQVPSIMDQSLSEQQSLGSAGEKDFQSIYPDGPRQRPVTLYSSKLEFQESPTDKQSSTATTEKSPEQKSQDGTSATLREEKEDGQLMDKVSGVSTRNMHAGDLDRQTSNQGLPKNSTETQEVHQKSNTSAPRKRLLMFSGAKPTPPTPSVNQDSSEVSDGSEKKNATRYIVSIALLMVVMASIPVFLAMIRRAPVHQNNILDRFFEEFASVKKDFPGQYEGLWIRSGKLLQKHLNTSDPGAPSILILTAARDGERTLRCVGKRIAKSYASSHNASWIMVSGPSKSKYDSATSKMQMDNELSSGFQSNSRAAVLHRLETLPAGSLLILYKYCDHENAAFKKVALILTVLLNEQSLETDLSFPEVEEKVKDLLWDRFANSDVIAHNEMDVDKLSGVWSRISHVVLPVMPVDSIESGSCPGT